MKAYQIATAGSAPRFSRIDLSPPGPGEVLLDIRACGLNFADLLMIKGSYQDTPEAPFTLGMEVAGKIRTTGAEVNDLKVGDPVMVFGGQGGLAEQGVFPAERCTVIPSDMPFEHAAALQIAYGTSHLALDYRAHLQPGENLVITGASGGVGLTAVEIGKLMGATVIAVARGKDKLAVAEQAGADHLLDAEHPDLRGALKALGGADVVYDAVGGQNFIDAFRACNPEARILTIGFASGDVPLIKANHLLVKNISVLGFYWGGYMKFNPQIVRQSLTTLVDWHQQGRIKPHISHTLPLDRVEEGLELLRTRKSTGKVVITP